MNLELILKQIEKAYEKDKKEYTKVNYYITAYIPTNKTKEDELDTANCYITMSENIMKEIKFNYFKHNEKFGYLITVEEFNRYLNLAVKIEIEVGRF